ncbi:short-chain dehydrogenase/reductase SDR [Fonsecaea pedrosoi]|nr:short-chain dehydrogenase/reductase SDR [Fonsecaea pedrosoi]
MGGFKDKLEGQNIIVVGGSTGIGFGAAAALLDVGARVTIISSSSAKLDAALQRLGSPNAKGVVADVRNEAAFTDTLRSLAPVDHVIFSAVDNIIRGKLEDQNLDEAKHLFGVLVLLKYDIVRKGGSLTLTSGTAGIKPGKNAAIGGALNGGVLSLTKGLAADLAEKKIRVNTVVPGLVKTPLWDKQGKTPEEQEEIFNKASQTLPVGFVATPEHIAEAYLYAVRADYSTGKLIEIVEGTLTHISKTLYPCPRREPYRHVNPIYIAQEDFVH